MKKLTVSFASSCLVLAAAACSPTPGPTDGAGGAPSSGGGSGGTGPGTGGALGSGGSGPQGTGGAPPLGTGGAGAGTGGSDPGGSGGGGNQGSGGTPGSGGAAAPEPELVTSGMGAYWQVGELTEGGTSANVTVNTGTTYQTWHGFGGTFNEKGWVAMKALSAADRELALRLLFDINDGAGFTYGRIPIGSSDYANDRYSLNSTAGDNAMTNFSIDRDKIDLIPYIQAALAIKPDIRLWASPWSPPPWMKDNNAFDKGNMKSDAATLGAHALYLARFVEEYELEGMTIEAIHPQNEPGYAQDYPSCLWSGATMATYISTYLGPLFADRLPDTEIWLGTMSNPNDASIVTTVMGNQTARGYVKGIGLQWGMGDSNAPSDYASQYQVPIMQTEHKCGNYPWENGTDQSKAPNDHAYAEESWGFFKNWIGKGVNSYSAWNMVLDTIGRSLDTVRPWAQNALLAVNVQEGSLVITPTYWLFRHLAQFVEPGAVRVGTTGGDALAFQNPDGSIVVMMYNSGGGAAETTLSVGGTMVQFSIPGRGWATVNWQGN
jgi:glucosylceramidase